jgi:hypothetical protein
VPDETPQQPEQQQIPTISSEGLNALYRDIGELRHALYERAVTIAGLQAEIKKRNEMLQVLYDKYGPPSDEASAAVPTPMAARGKRG